MRVVVGQAFRLGAQFISASQPLFAVDFSNFVPLTVAPDLHFDRPALGEKRTPFSVYCVTLPNRHQTVGSYICPLALHPFARKRRSRAGRVRSRRGCRGSTRPATELWANRRKRPLQLVRVVVRTHRPSRSRRKYRERPTERR